MPRLDACQPHRAGYPLPPLPLEWARVLAGDLAQPWFTALQDFLDTDAREHALHPPPGEVFRALELTPPAQVRVVLLGKDPYPGPGHANGLCFSVHRGVKPPPSLRNIFSEFTSDTGLPAPAHGALDAWARRGVLLLNAVLTVRSGEAGAHRGRGWERFTDAVIRHVAARTEPVVFALWGAWAQRKAALIAGSHHPIVAAAHPSPLSAHNGFFGSRPFSRIDAALVATGGTPMDWRIPD
jgi:uracil-DNA glycosylase